MKRIHLKFLIITALMSLACTTKVSEWVLLNSEPDKYLLVYFHKGEITQSERLQNTELATRLKSANIVFKTLVKNEIKKPYYALYFKNRLLFEYVDHNDLNSIVSSPLRKKIAAELMSGKLCVMLYLKCGNQEKDERGQQVVKRSIALSPFRDIITVIELDRNSMAENQFVSMLLNVESDLIDIQEPMLFGIFGRLRALEPLLAKGISEENINLMIDYLNADCSCLIKDQLPGINILYDGNWENPLPAMVNKILDENPDLTHR